jgi:DHA2 family multidrug resistance protein-like MFS transporter
MGTAVLGTAGMAVYSSRVVETATLPGMDADSANAASQTLAGAHEVAETLPGGGGARLLEIADSAFLAGMDLVAAIGIGTAAITLALAWRGLRSESREAGAVGAAGAAGAVGVAPMEDHDAEAAHPTGEPEANLPYVPPAARADSAASEVNRG